MTFEELVNKEGASNVYANTSVDEATQAALMEWLFDRKLCDEPATFCRYYRRNLNKYYPQYLDLVRVLTVRDNMDPYVTYYFEHVGMDTGTGKTGVQTMGERTVATVTHDNDTNKTATENNGNLSTEGTSANTRNGDVNGTNTERINEHTFTIDTKTGSVIENGMDSEIYNNVTDAKNGTEIEKYNNVKDEIHRNEYTTNKENTTDTSEQSGVMYTRMSGGHHEKNNPILNNNSRGTVGDVNIHKEVSDGFAIAYPDANLDSIKTGLVTEDIYPQKRQIAEPAKGDNRASINELHGGGPAYTSYKGTSKAITAPSIKYASSEQYIPKQSADITEKTTGSDNLIYYGYTQKDGSKHPGDTNLTVYGVTPSKYDAQGNVIDGKKSPYKTETNHKTNGANANRTDESKDNYDLKTGSIERTYNGLSNVKNGSVEHPHYKKTDYQDYGDTDDSTKTGVNINVSRETSEITDNGKTNTQQTSHGMETTNGTSERNGSVDTKGKDNINVTTDRTDNRKNKVQEKGRQESIADIVPRAIKAITGTTAIAWLVDKLSVCFDNYEYMEEY